MIADPLCPPAERTGEVRVLLHEPGWVHERAAAARGGAFFGAQYLDARAIAVHAEALRGLPALRDFVARLNGHFALVVRRADTLFAAVDRLRAMPLFFALSDGVCVVADRAPVVRDACALHEADPVATLEFYLAGYVTRDATLFRGLRQLRAGECLWRAGDAVPQCAQYYRYTHDEGAPAASADRLVETLHEVHRRVFERLLQSAGDRPIVVPLSGGYDSRLIATWLHELGAKPICYTYGLTGNWESQLSRDIAAHFGFTWHFVPYSGARWKTWAASEPMRAYQDYAGNYSSIPHVQDWPAILELRNLLPRDAIIVPGHTGDFISGGHIPPGFARAACVTHQHLRAAIHAKHYNLWRWPRQARVHRAALDARIDATLGEAVAPARAYAAETAAGLYELWEWQERQAKFICNSLRVYDFHGYEWRLPLYDHELMDFWARVPLAQRAGRRLFYAYVGARQRLPVGAANQDHPPWLAGCIRALDISGLKPLAKWVQYRRNRLRWAAMHDNCTTPPLGWLSLVDRELFRRTYTGRESVHAYLARMYLDRQTGLVP